MHAAEVIWDPICSVGFYNVAVLERSIKCDDGFHRYASAGTPNPSLNSLPLVIWSWLITISSRQEPFYRHQHFPFLMVIWDNPFSATHLGLGVVVTVRWSQVPPATTWHTIRFSESRRNSFKFKNFVPATSPIGDGWRNGSINPGVNNGALRPTMVFTTDRCCLWLFLLCHLLSLPNTISAAL